MFGLLDVVCTNLSAQPTAAARLAAMANGRRVFMGLVGRDQLPPCTWPVLRFFILTFHRPQPTIIFGVNAMFAFSLGLGLPFLILGTFSVRCFPPTESGKGWIVGQIFSLAHHAFISQSITLGWP